MRWAVIAPFFEDMGPPPVQPSIWIDDFDDSGRHQYLKLPAIRALQAGNWHDRKRRATPLGIWLGHWRQSRRALRSGCSGVITVFPQLAITAAIQKAFSLTRRKTPVLAWCFNVGEKPSWPYAIVAQIFLRYVDQFVVHSRGEIETLHHWFGIPRTKIAFVPLQRAPISLTAAEETLAPFVVAMGSANRDYATLIEAMQGLPLRLVLVASARSLAGLVIPDNVEVVNGLTAQECRVLAQRARINIVPLADVATASGQVTIVEALRMGRPLIATRGIGSVDYVTDGENAVLVGAGNISELRAAITMLWDDPALRAMLSRNALAYAAANLSDEMAASKMAVILDQLI